MSQKRNVWAGVLGGMVLMLAAQLAWAQAPASLQGKTVLVTGSTDGLGREVALRVAALGAQVIVHGRNQPRGAAVVDEITRGGQGTARFYAADFASIEQVHEFARTVLRDYPRIDVLVNNAGVWSRTERRESLDGHELHFAVNYLAGYILTRALLPRLVASAPSRIVNVASTAQSPIDFEDVMLEQPGRAGRGYGQSKLAQVMMTMDLAEETRGKHVTVVALHPATLMDTSMVEEAGMPARSTVAEGADAVMHLVTGSGIESGQYFNGLEPARANAQAYDVVARERLRRLSEALANER